MSKKGFTLIELVIVIVILGILAAVAIPRFVGLTKEAKISAVKGFAGSLRAAADIVHAKWLAMDNNSGTVNVEGKVVLVDNNTDPSTVAGYPLSTLNGIGNAVRYDPDKFTVSNNGDNMTFSYKGNINCSVSYIYASRQDEIYTSAPRVSVATSGCK